MILTNCSNIQQREADIVASVKGIGDISFNELQNHYRDYQFDLKYRNNPEQGYQEALQSLVLFKRKVADFKREEMYENKKLMNPIQRYVNEEIRRLYFEVEYLGKYINEASITSYYQLMNKEVTYQQLILNKYQNQNTNLEISVESRIDQILSEFNSGTEFDTIVSKYSEDITSNNNGLMPPINWQNGWLNSTNRAISSMNIGDIEVLESESLYYIIKISDIKIIDIPQLNNIRPIIIKNLREQYLDRALQEFAFMED
ncbi:peptidyl-prolyl cis-trans isomerase, partial [Bacteroidota bacterium]|nr:peptidyl-prolyl cis-trans isomerase [Bacteroidota bacterium]